MVSNQELVHWDLTHNWMDQILFGGILKRNLIHYLISGCEVSPGNYWKTG